MKIEQMPLGPLGTNCYIVSNENNSLIFDPGGDAYKVIEYLTENSLTAEAILLTHAHFDHIGAVEELRNYFNINVYLHEEEALWLANPALNGSLSFTGEEVNAKEPDIYLKTGKLKIGSFALDVLYTPGHSPGSVSFLFNDQSFVISGDVLFHQGIGRTDLPGGDFSQLENSIRNDLYQLPDSFAVYPGHGPQTTIGSEKKYNPFFKA